MYVKEADVLLDGARRLAESVIVNSITRRNYDRAQLKSNIRDEISRYIFKQTKRRPMVIPVIMEL